MAVGINVCEEEDDFFGKFVVFEYFNNFALNFHGVIFIFFGGGFNFAWHPFSTLVFLGFNLAKLPHDIVFIIGVEGVFVFGLDEAVVTELGMMGS